MRNVKELSLSPEQRQWIDRWLELWGSWVASGRLEKRMSSVIAQYMATVEPQGSPSRPMCNDDDGMLISQVVDFVMCIDTKALGILISYYSHGASKRSIASYYFATAKPRKMLTRGGDRLKKPSLITCRREVDEILDASLWMLYQPMQHAFISRKRVGKIKKVA